MSFLFSLGPNSTLFLDRDGVINEKLENRYVVKFSEFRFKLYAIEAIKILSNYFSRIIIVTNQRGIGKGIMDERDLSDIHARMISLIHGGGGRIDNIYHCPDLEDSSFERKPNVGMAIKAKIDFPKIEFRNSIMVGDSLSDMEFGKNLGMYCFLISDIQSTNLGEFNTYQSLYEFAKFIESICES